jgi:DNA repair exonuclease SbcCD ATPase subunit
MKRWIGQPLPDGIDPNGDLVIIRADVVLASDHDRIVAELKAENERLKRVVEKLREQRNFYCDMAQMPDKSYQEHVEQCDAELDAQLAEHDRIVAELKAENDILKSKASQFESTLKETMRVRDAEIEKLKRVVEKLKGMVSHYETCATVDRYDDEDVPCDCGLDKELAAIEKGSEIDKLREHFGYT